MDRFQFKQKVLKLKSTLTHAAFLSYTQPFELLPIIIHYYKCPPICFQDFNSHTHAFFTYSDFPFLIHLTILIFSCMQIYAFLKKYTNECEMLIWQPAGFFYPLHFKHSGYKQIIITPLNMQICYSKFLEYVYAMTFSNFKSMYFSFPPLAMCLFLKLQSLQ